jgi:hypothetical protein
MPLRCSGVDGAGTVCTGTHDAHDNAVHLRAILRVLPSRPWRPSLPFADAEGCWELTRQRAGRDLGGCWQGGGSCDARQPARRADDRLDAPDTRRVASFPGRTRGWHRRRFSRCGSAPLATATPMNAAGSRRRARTLRSPDWHSRCTAHHFCFCGPTRRWSDGVPWIARPEMVDRWLTAQAATRGPDAEPASERSEQPTCRPPRPRRFDGQG